MVSPLGDSDGLDANTTPLAYVAAQMSNIDSRDSTFFI